MAILAECGCGKRYRVKDELAGRKVRCKACGEAFAVPVIAEVVEPLMAESIPTEPVMATPVPSTSPPASPPPPATFPGPTSPAGGADVFAAPVAEEADRQRMQQELDYARQASNSAASNPGMFRVSYLRWFKAFPKWVLIWHSLLIASLLMTIFVHWAFAILVLFFAWAVRLYWHRVKYQFISGCVNPGQVVSLRPPLVAVVTDLTKGGSDCLVAKVLQQPLAKMAGGMPSLGQRVATVAYYNEINSELDHWDDFEPIVADCVTGNREDLSRVLASIDQESWQELQLGLTQIPSPPQPGLYRIYKPEELQHVSKVQPADITMLVHQYLEEASYCHCASSGIKPEVMRQAQSYVPAAAMANAVAIVESSHHSSDASEGLTLTGNEVLYCFKNEASGSFAYTQLAGAFSFDRGVELAFRSGQRLLLPKRHFLSGTQVALEQFFNSVVHA